MPGAAGSTRPQQGDNMSDDTFALPPSVALRPDQPHPARLYDYYLKGKDNFPADRAAGEIMLAHDRLLRVVAQENRAFLGRAVKYLASEAGVQQFLDIGTGLPAANNTHEVAQAATRDARVVYVDNDPIVLTHARALLDGLPPSQIAYIQADLRTPRQILDDPELRRVLDFGRPIALLLIAVLHFVEDRDDPYGAVATLVDSLPPGSFLAMSHVTHDLDPARWKRTEELYRQHGMTAQSRTWGQFDEFFKGLELVAPGRQSIVKWRPGETLPEDAPTEQDVSCYAAIGRKP